MEAQVKDQVAGRSELVQPQPLLMQHFLAFAAATFLQRSEFHQNGHSDLVTMPKL
jgi:hypothetical protein